ncbi:MAG: hypothetical protein QM704_01890 [Anaeromyxobacteraceae bacterium]
MTKHTAIALCLAAAALFLAPRTAADDHRQYLDSKPEECRECHRGSGVMDNHGAEFARGEHRVLAQQSDANCGSCHAQSFCVNCHEGGAVDRLSARRSDPATTASRDATLSRRGEVMPGSHGADFLSTHAIKAADEPRSCARCHDTKTFCQDCHQRQKTSGRAFAVKTHKPIYVAPGVPDPSWVDTHRADARRNLQSCAACHPSKDSCSSFACHPGLAGK